MFNRIAIRYLALALLAATSLAAATAILTVMVDPYYAFGARLIEGLTSLKPRADEQIDIAKASLLARARPTTLILGNSRAEIGLDPRSSAWPSSLRPVFNCSLAGHDMFSELLYFLDDLALKRPRLVLVGADFQDFISAGDNNSEPPVLPLERRLLVDRHGTPNKDRWVQSLVDMGTSTMAIGALSDSFLTVASQDPRSSPTLTTDGYNPLHEYEYFVRHEGAYVLFAQKRAAYQVQYRRFKPSDFSRPALNPEFRELDALLDAARKSGTRVIVFTYPYHAEYYDMLRGFRLWSSFLAWKAALTSDVSRFTRNSDGRIQLYDFALVNDITSEPAPSQADRGRQMQWYWEPGHFKSALGDQMILRMTGGAGSALEYETPAR